MSLPFLGKGRSPDRTHGSLDGPSYGTARGWAFDPDHPDRHVSVELLIDQKLFQTIEASLFREDLQKAGIAKGDHAFAITLPTESLDGKSHIVEVRIAGAGTQLSNSPMTFVHRDPPQEGAAQTNQRNVSRLPRKSPGAPDALAVPDSVLGGISVVIPTFNRAALMEETLRFCLDSTGEAEVEFIVVNDGSTDDTPQRLERLAAEFPKVRWTSVPNGGPGRARNAGVLMATHELILFQGDDTRPASDGFYSHHLNAHRLLPSSGVAVLGKIIWPNSSSDRINFVMSHVQGRGETQFGFYSRIPYSWLDWRFFYTSNVSFKKSIVSDWNKDGFHPAFRGAGWEDAEFSYRLYKHTQGDFRIFYTPAATATHHHPYSVRQFVERQLSVGLVAKTFLELHPEVAKILDLAKMQKLLASPLQGPTQCDDLISMIEGIKAWPKVIEERYNLGSQNWHADLLSAVFEMCYLQGFIMAHTDANANFPAAYAYILERFQERMAAAASFEVFGRFPGFTLT